MAKVRVWVRLEQQIPYVIDVENPENIEEIRRVLENTDPSDWESEPSFYECLGSSWRYHIEATKDFMAERVG